MAAGYPSGSNTFVPSFDASGHLVVQFSRDVKSFAANKYVTLSPVKKSSGYYLRITAEVAARVINSDLLREFVWADGDDAPKGDWNAEAFEFKTFNTQRYAFPFRIGYKANEQADFKILQSFAANEAAQAMTARTVKIHRLILTSGNYDSGHVDTATNWGGGAINSGTATSPVFKKILNAMAFKIVLATLGRVQPKDLVVVMNPRSADALGRSQEIHSYLKESPYALAQVRGDAPSQNGQWGMPDQLYGYKIVVDDTVRVTSKKGATRAADFSFTDAYVAMLARPGELVAPAGGPSFSSVHVFAYEEMTVEQRDDPGNRRIEGRVVEDNDVTMVSPASSCLCTGTLA